MWEDFQKEQFNRLTITSDYGFITYELFSDDSVYIHILYIKPDCRASFKGKLLEDMIIEKHNPKSIYCYVDLTSNSPEQSLACILKAGYKLNQVSSEKIVLGKTLR